MTNRQTDRRGSGERADEAVPRSGTEPTPESRTLTVRGTRYDIGLPEERAASTKEAFTAAGSAAVIGAVLTGFITVIPDIDAAWQWPVVIATSGIFILMAALFLRRSVQRFLFHDPSRDITSYIYNPERGLLFKGDIRNVAFRVDTVHALLDGIVKFVPEKDRCNALYQAGYDAGQSWSREFLKHRGTQHSLELSTMLIQWAHYDATAGMGRLSVAVSPELNRGTVLLANSFLSTRTSSFPLNYWFAGYIAATLNCIFTRRVGVILSNPTTEEQSETVFDVSVELS